MLGLITFRPLYFRRMRPSGPSVRSLADASCDEPWKWKSNYFKNHWNREEFGNIQKKANKAARKSETTTKSHDFWIERMANKDTPNDLMLPQIQARAPKEDNLFNALATASFELNHSDVTESNPPDIMAEPVASPIKISPSLASESPSWINPEKPVISLPLSTELKPTLINYRRNQLRSSLPSVSKILKATMPVDRAVALAQWEERMIAQMGQAGFEAYQKTMLARGHRLHSYIEHYLLEGTKAMDSEDDVSLKHTQSIGPLLNHFSHPHSLESQVVHPTLKYHGYLDCVAVYKEKTLALIDWKTSEKKKASLSSTFDNPLQIAAYIGALNHDPRYPFQIDHGLIVIVHNDGHEAKVLGISKQKMDIYWKAWLERLKLYEAMSKYGK
eukprot:TCALIF_00005-PA protein Name:"Similar to mgme1 Mitochondrial genome maintenance exonuclease 1 (Xenopus tropicalis)" AED:0.45 eAED:0.48 QI:0/-1/0/1/-1/1/1/0/386